MNDEPTIGHNRGVAGSELEAFFKRLQRLEEDVKELNSDKADIRAEAKARGYDMKAFAKAFALWKLDPEDRAVLGVYTSALGVFG